MSNRLLGFRCISVIIFPVEAIAEAWINQDSCVVYEEEEQLYVRVYFSLLNNSPSDPLCGFDFIPEPLPPSSGCEILELGYPIGWHACLDPEGTVEWFAKIPDFCIDHGDSKGGFYIVLDPAYGCFAVQFCGTSGTLLLEQEECLDCKEVGTGERSWGMIKSFYLK